jgi:hypothetical protein
MKKKFFHAGFIEPLRAPCDHLQGWLSWPDLADSAPAMRVRAVIAALRDAGRTFLGIMGAANPAETVLGNASQVRARFDGFEIFNQSRGLRTRRRGLNRLGASGRVNRAEAPVSSGRLQVPVLPKPG